MLYFIQSPTLRGFKTCPHRSNEKYTDVRSGRIFVSTAVAAHKIEQKMQDAAIEKSFLFSGRLIGGTTTRGKVSLVTIIGSMAGKMIIMVICGELDHGIRKTTH